MDLQHQRIAALCEELRLAGIAGQWPALAQDAAGRSASFADFLEAALTAERELRRARARTTLATLASFPAVKTLDQYDFDFAVGAPKKQSMELA